jgi:hypothetical protein
MNELAGDCMCIPSELGDGAGTNDPGDGTCNCGLLGEPAARMLPGDGVPINVDGEGAICLNKQQRFKSFCFFFCMFGKHFLFTDK